MLTLHAPFIILVGVIILLLMVELLIEEQAEDMPEPPKMQKWIRLFSGLALLLTAGIAFSAVGPLRLSTPELDTRGLSSGNQNTPREVLEENPMPISPRSGENSNDLLALDKSAVLRGIDVSHWQDVRDWQALRNDNVHFAFIKAMQSQDREDKTFKAKWDSAKANGLIRGAYQVFEDKHGPQDQAKKFVKLLKKHGLEKSDLPPVLDVEHNKKYAIGDYESPEKLASYLFTWLEIVEKGTGRIPIIYANPSFIKEHLTDPKFQRYPLWMADYGDNTGQPADFPPVPAGPWQENQWLLWQFTDNGQVNGIDSRVDLNFFNGSLNDLNDFIAKTNKDGR